VATRVKRWSAMARRRELAFRGDDIQVDATCNGRTSVGRENERTQESDEADRTSSAVWNLCPVDSRHCRQQ